MAGFNDLPNEMVLEVLEMVSLEDLENFAQISKRVFLLARPFLQPHRQWIRLYTKLTSDSSHLRTRYTEKPNGFQLGPIPSLLKDMVNEPCIGRYIRCLKLDSLITTYSGKGRGNKRYINPVEAGSLYHRQRDLVDAVIALSNDPNLQWFYDLKKGSHLYPDHGYEELLIALLFPLLPNLNRLSIVWDPKLHYFHGILRRSALDGNCWLKNLSTVHLRTLPGSYRLWLSDLRLFSTLPALKSLTAVRLYDGGGTAGEVLRSQSSHMKILRLISTNVTRKRLHCYIQSFPSLQTFAFAYNALLNEVVGRKNFDPYWIRTALLHHSKIELQSLTILGPIGHDNYMGSLQPFEALREICTEWEFLFPEQYHFETWPSWILPASLRELQIRDNSNRSSNEYRLFFRGLRRAKDRTCFHLDLVDIGNAWEKRHKVKELGHLYGYCKGIGLTLNFQEVSSKFHGSSQMSLTFDAEIEEAAKALAYHGKDSSCYREQFARTPRSGA